jgi:hypothetical protein
VEKLLNFNIFLVINKFNIYQKSVFKGNWTISYIRIFAQQHIEAHYGKWRKKPMWIDHDEDIYLARQKINLYATK